MVVDRDDLNKIGGIIEKIRKSQNIKYELYNEDLIYFLRKSYAAVEANIIYNENKALKNFGIEGLNWEKD